MTDTVPPKCLVGVVESVRTYPDKTVVRVDVEGAGKLRFDVPAAYAAPWVQRFGRKVAITIDVTNVDSAHQPARPVHDNAADAT